MFPKLIGETHAARVRRIFWALCIVLGFLQAWASRMTISSDAVSYFDIGGFIWRGSWSMAINGLWNPLYSTMLGVAVGLVHPSFYWKYPLVHLVVFLIFLFALACFDLFLREMILLRQETETGDELSVPEWIWLSIGYVLFLWSSLRLITVSETNPDMLIAAFFYLACAMLIRIRRGDASWMTFVWLGLALGLGYLTKSIMFPVSLCCLAGAFSIGRDRHLRVWASTAVFLAACAPYIVALSLAKGRFTFGDSGQYNYAVHVNKIPLFHWQGGPDGNAWPLHPTREIFRSPAAFEFKSPIGGTYPAWTDPTYWYTGLHPHFNLRQAASNQWNLIQSELLLLSDLHGSIFAGLFVLLYVSERSRSASKDRSIQWFLIVPCLCTLGFYSMIHFEPRYVGPFIAVLLLAGFFATSLPRNPGSLQLYTAVAALLLIMFFEPLQGPSLHIREFVNDVLGHSVTDPNSPPEVVKEMYQMGMRPGDQIASLQRSDFGMSTWACLARIQIVSEIPYWPGLPELAGNDFWKADPDIQREAIHALADTGPRFIVSQLAPPQPSAPGWSRVGSTQYYVYRIDAHS